MAQLELISLKMQIMRSPISEAVPKWGKVTAYNTTLPRISLKMLNTDLSIRETWMRPVCNEFVGTLKEWQHAGQQQQALPQFSAWFPWRRSHFFWLIVLTFIWPSLNSECPDPCEARQRSEDNGKQDLALRFRAQCPGELRQKSLLNRTLLIYFFWDESLNL